MVTVVRVMPMGDRALLVETGDLADVLALRGRLDASRPEGVRDLVPAARTVLVDLDPRVLPLAAARAWIERVATAGTPPPRAASSPAEVELRVRYDGPDLDDTAALLGLDPDALIRAHRDAAWTVAFTGFAPGFGYLVADDWTYDVPRLDSPRARVPAGAVGLAAGFTGAYPRETPGGWRLVATLDPLDTASLFDPDATAPALLAPGTRVRFREARPPISGRSRGPVARHAEPRHPSPGVSPRRPAGMPAAGFRIDAPGLLATVQDLGRGGLASLGVSRSGALDRGALRAANRILGNDEGAAALEITLGGFAATARADLWIAAAGAWGRLRIAGHDLDPYAAHPWPAGERLEWEPFTAGLRGYLAVRGGLDVPRSVGSRSADLLAGLGPAPLRAGDEVAVGAAAAPVPVGELMPWSPPRDSAIEVPLSPGPRADWFTADAHRLLFEHPWTASARADRVGVRLDGPALPRRVDGELPSEGMVPGALQVPPDGRPVVLLADGPVTGGYPVIAVVADAALDLFAQVRPGTGIRFRHAR